jgi:hypothetical protein
MNICVVSMYTKEIEVMGELTDANKRAYCQKHGYQYNCHFGRISKRHAAWDKILAVMRLLPFYDYVVWMDADCIFNNFDKKLEDYIFENTKGTFVNDIAISYADRRWHYVNTGVFILKHDQVTFDFLNEVWNKHTDDVDTLDKRSYNGWPWDQGAIIDYLLKSDDFKILEDMDLNAHPNVANNDTFIIHYMGWRSSAENEHATLETVKNKIK